MLSGGWGWGSVSQLQLSAPDDVTPHATTEAVWTTAAPKDRVGSNKASWATLCGCGEGDELPIYDRTTGLGFEQW